MILGVYSGHEHDVPGHVRRAGVAPARPGVRRLVVDPAERSFEFLLLADGKHQLKPQTEARYASPRSPELAIDLAESWSEVARQTARAR